MVWIAWNISSDALAWPPATLERKVEIFYERVKGWQLYIADLIANGGLPLGGGEPMKQVRHSGFAVLHICLSYFETIGHYQGSSGREAFERGVRAVFPNLFNNYDADDAKGLLNLLYVGARCGMYHNSMTVPGVGLGQPAGDQVMEYDPLGKRLVISPERLPRVLREHLERFRASLLDPPNVTQRKDFERRFDEDHRIGASP